MKNIYMALIAILAGLFFTDTDMKAGVPLCNEENTWVYETSVRTLREMKDASIDRGSYEMKFVGTREVQGRTYHVFKVVKSIFREISRVDRKYVYHEFGPEVMSEEWLLREEGDKVWYWHETWQKEVIMYDFSVKSLDPMPGLSWGSLPLVEDSNYCAFRMYPGDGDGISPRVYCLGELSGSDYRRHENTMCIEGIGVTRGSMCYIYTFCCWHTNEDVSIDTPGGDCCMLTGVIDKEGKYIYGEPNTIQNSVSSVNVVKMNEYKSPRYFNLQGNPVAKPRPGELVVKVTDAGTDKIIYEENN